MFREVALFAVVMAVATAGGPAATEAVAAVPPTERNGQGHPDPVRFS